MKILQAPHNIVNIPYIISKSFRKYGYVSDVVEFRPDERKFGKVDFTIYKGTIQEPEKPSILDKVKHLSFALYAIVKYDIFLFHTRNTLLPKDYDIHILNKLKTKKYYIYHHGSDVSGKKDYYKHVPHARKAKAIFISTPDLYDYVPDSCILLPQAIDCELLNKFSIKDRNFSESLKEPITITHAIGSSKRVRKNKGSDLIINGIELLKKRGFNINFKFFVGKNYRKVIKEIASADIHIDQLGIGWYGTITAEAMALGTPVICDIRPDLEKYANNIPLFRANKINITHRLEELILDVSLRKKLSKKGKKFAYKIHDGKQIGKKLLDVYNI